MMSFINGVHQLSQAKALQVLTGGVEEGEGAEREKKAGWGLNGAAGDNDRAVGFDDGSKWVSGEYECDI